MQKTKNVIFSLGYVTLQTNQILRRMLGSYCLLTKIPVSKTVRISDMYCTCVLYILHTSICIADLRNLKKIFWVLEIIGNNTAVTCFRAFEVKRTEKLWVRWEYFVHKKKTNLKSETSWFYKMCGKTILTRSVGAV